MKIKRLNAWRKEVEINAGGCMFDITCKKCGSREVDLIADDDLSMGSEYTGIYGSASAVIKCKSCGNAYTLNVADF